MATINKKISETDYERIGDTQGLMIPRDREPDWDSGIIESVTPGTVSYLQHNLNTPLNRLDIIVMIRRNQDNIWQRFDSQSYAGSQTFGFCLSEIDNNSIAFDIANAGLFIYYNHSTLITANAFRVSIWKKTERVPYIIANKGALVSSDTVGKAKIDADDGTMNINGEFGTGTDGSKVSINRPDLWPVGVELDFDGGLYGRRQVGNITLVAGTVLDTIIVSNFGICPFISTGGLIQHVNQNFGAFGCIYGEGALYFSSLYIANSSLVLSLRDPQSGTAHYDIWVTYKR